MSKPAYLRPFFSYYGSKWLMGPYYPAPRYRTLIEPFAGSAGYALLHNDRDVVLYDKSPEIVELWNYLIWATEKDILDLPIEVNDIRDLQLPLGARYLIGFWLGRSYAHPANVPTAWMRTGKYPNSFWGVEKRERVASQLQYIRHWRCELADYENVPNCKATWFVDPPYSSTGNHYKHWRVDYPKLAEWCKGREGQVIVTGQVGESWLPFKFLRETRTPMAGGAFSKEAVYLMENDWELPRVEEAGRA